jgi:hypothetical protein
MKAAVVTFAVLGVPRGVAAGVFVGRPVRGLTLGPWIFHERLDIEWYLEAKTMRSTYHNIDGRGIVSIVAISSPETDLESCYTQHAKGRVIISDRSGSKIN